MGLKVWKLSIANYIKIESQNNLIVHKCSISKTLQKSVELTVE